MNRESGESMQELVRRISERRPLGQDAQANRFVRRAGEPDTQLYAHHNERLGIEFLVERLDFPGAQTLDPRIVRIPPGRNNERHRHAHESIFVVLRGRGQVLIGTTWHDVRAGSFAFVPRWVFHQSRNTGSLEDLVVLAIADLGLTRAVLGNYDRGTRLKEGSADARPCDSTEVA